MFEFNKRKTRCLKGFTENVTPHLVFITRADSYNYIVSLGASVQALHSEEVCKYKNIVISIHA